MLESQLEKKLVRHCRDHGIYTRKFSSPANRGVPDRVFAAFGKCLFLELKAKGNKPTDLQLHELKLLNEAGIKATWCDDYDRAVEIISEYLIEDVV